MCSMRWRCDEPQLGIESNRIDSAMAAAPPPSLAASAFAPPTPLRLSFFASKPSIDIRSLPSLQLRRCQNTAGGSSFQTDTNYAPTIATSAPTTGTDADTDSPRGGKDSPISVSSLKVELLALVAGLDRGLAGVGAEEAAEVARMAEKLEAWQEEGEAEKVEERLQGRWRLVYSSGFAATGSLGGRRPGPPAAALPPLFKLGQVYQRIDVLAKELDNIVFLNAITPWPLPSLQVKATLAHSYKIQGDNIEIIFEKTSVKLEGWDLIGQAPPIDLPELPPSFLRPFQGLRSGRFQVTFLDDNMRITRGDRGELRIFVLT